MKIGDRVQLIHPGTYAVPRHRLRHRAWQGLCHLGPRVRG